MMKWLISLLRRTREVSSKGDSASRLPLSHQTEQGIPLYPPNDPGIPSESTERVLECQSDLVTRIRRAAGVTPEAFSRYETPIRNLAAYVHLLPATDTQYFVGAGGLLRMSLEIGLHSLQLSHASIFPNIGSIEKRASIIPKWELATFLAAICSQLYRPLTNMVVTDRANRQWPQILQPLDEWLQQVEAPRYFIRWTPGVDSAERQSCATYVINRIIPADVLQYLNEDNSSIVASMTSAISGGDLNPSENPIARIVAPITTRVIQEDRLQNCRHYGNYSLGIHLEPHLIDSMRRLIKSGKWSINVKGARVWVGSDGVFLVWGAAAKDIIALLTVDSFVGLPQDPDTLADILIDAKVLLRNVDQGRYWTIVLPESGALIDNAVRLVNDFLIFPSCQDLAAMRTVALCVDVVANAAPITQKPVETKQRRSRKGKDTEAEKLNGDQSTTSVIEMVSPQRGPADANIAADLNDSTAATGPQLDLDVRAEESKSSVGQGVPSMPAWVLPHTAECKSMQNTTVEPAVMQVEPTVGDKSPLPTIKLDEVSEKFLSMLSRESQWLVKQISKAQQKGTLTGVLVNLVSGLGISDTELAAHGMPTPDFLNDLASRNWLWVDKSKPLRKVHRVEVNGKIESLVIIQPHVARGLGFDWLPPVENGDE